MIASQEWLNRARVEIDPDLFENARFREVFEALLHPETVEGQMPGGLSDDAQLSWSRLRESAQDGSQRDLYDNAAQILLARRQYREMDALTDPGEKRSRRADLRARFPAADAWYEYQKAALKETRPSGRSRGA
jgi:hypothetical protein